MGRKEEEEGEGERGEECVMCTHSVDKWDLLRGERPSFTVWSSVFPFSIRRWKGPAHVALVGNQKAWYQILEEPIWSDENVPGCHGVFLDRCCLYYKWVNGYLRNLSWKLQVFFQEWGIIQNMGKYNPKLAWKLVSRGCFNAHKCFRLIKGKIREQLVEGHFRLARKLLSNLQIITKINRW